MEFFTTPFLFMPFVSFENYVHWSQTPESHIYTVDLPGVRKEEIKVEIEDSRYLVIRTEAAEESREPAKKFMRKFRLPCFVNIGRVSAAFENGVLIITVPRSRRGLHLDPADLPLRHEILAPAA